MKITDAAYEAYLRNCWVVGVGPRPSGSVPLLRPPEESGEVGIGRHGRVSGRDQKAIAALTGTHQRDVVTNLWPSHRLNKSVLRALKGVREDGQTWSLAYVEVPANLKGLNPVVADAGSNVFMRQMSLEVIAKLVSLYGPGNVLGFRGKGPGIWVLVQAASGGVRAELASLRENASEALSAGRTIEQIHQPDDPNPEDIKWAELPHPSDQKLTGVEILSTVADLADLSANVERDKETPESTHLNQFLLKTEKDFNALYKSDQAKGPPFKSQGLIDPGILEMRGPALTEKSCGQGTSFDNTVVLAKRSLSKRRRRIGEPDEGNKTRPAINELDATTGAYLGVHRIPTMARAIQHVAAHPDGRAFSILLDIGNLSAIDGVLGREDADKMLSAAVRILRDELEAVGAKLSLFRHGGDEFMAVLTGNKGLTQEACELACGNARTRIKELSEGVRFICEDGQARSVAEIPHPKDPTNPARRGMSLYFAVKQMKAEPTTSSRKVRIEGEVMTPREAANRLADELGTALEEEKDKAKKQGKAQPPQ